MGSPIIIEDLEQGSEEWFASRIGIPTASNFAKILTPKTLKMSAQAKQYAIDIIAEEYEPSEPLDSEWVLRGIELEDQAREAYEFLKDVKVEQVGIAYKDDSKSVSCSPDGLIPDSGLEIKCPKLTTHINYLLNGTLPDAYIMQVQGSMWVMGLDTYDFMSYHPSAKPFVITVNRDEKIMDALDEAIPKFNDLVSEIKDQIK